MNVVSDKKVIIAIMGIRNVTWGQYNEAHYGRSRGPYFVRIQYKGAFNDFDYTTESEAQNMFDKIRLAMDKSYKELTGK